MIRAGEILVARGKAGLWLDYLAVVRRMQIQAGHTPQRAEYNCDRAMVDLWHKAASRVFGEDRSMLAATEGDLRRVLVKIATAIDLDDTRFTFYPDGWREQVRKWKT